MINISVFLIEQYKDNVSSLQVENSNLHLRTIKSQQKFIFSKHVVESVRKHMSLLLSGLLVQSERRLMSYIETQGQTTATQGCQRGKVKHSCVLHDSFHTSLSEYKTLYMWRGV